MARTSAGADLTAAQRRRQIALRALVLREMTTLWGTWSPGDVAGFDRYARLATTLLAARHEQSAGLALGYARAFRVAEGVGTRELAVPLPARLTLDDVRPSLLVTALGSYRRAVKAGLSPQAAARQGLVGSLGTAGRLTMNGGRSALVAATDADPRATGWVRVTSGSPCAFCTMLASRGPAYRSQRTADFEAHDHCGCTVEVAYEGSALPPSTAAAQRRYIEATKGLSGKDALAALRTSLADTAG